MPAALQTLGSLIFLPFCFFLRVFLRCLRGLSDRIQLLRGEHWLRGSRYLRAVLRELLDRKQLHFEDQSSVWWYFRHRHSFFAVRQLGRNEDLPLGTCGHELQGFLPARNHSLNRERNRRAVLPLIRIVELGSVQQTAFVMAHGSIQNCG